MTITHSDVGCWVLKCDPQRTWDYFAALAHDGHHQGGTTGDTSFTLGNTYRNGLIRAGDRIVLWVTGPRNPGVYEFGTVTDPVEDRADGFDKRFAIDLAKANKPSKAVPYQAVRLGTSRFIRRAALVADPDLAACEQLRAPQVTNPSYLDRRQTRALARLIAAQVTPQQMKDAGWSRLAPRSSRK